MMTKSYAAAAVFPLLGYALPEAFEVDVEPEWPTGALDSLRSGEFYPEAAFEPRPVQGVSQPNAQHSSSGSASFSPFSLPAWLEPATHTAPARAPLDPFLAMPPPPSPVLAPRPPPAMMPAPPLPPAPPTEPTGLFTLPPWLDPLPAPAPAPPPPRMAPPAAPISSPMPGAASPFSPFSPFEDAERTIHYPPQSIGPVPGSFPSWLEPLPQAVTPPASENLSFPSNVATPPAEASHGGWLERAMIPPPPPVSEPRMSEPFTPAPPFVEPLLPETQAVPPAAEPVQHPGWRDPSFDPPTAVPAVPTHPEPHQPAFSAEEPPMFRAPPPLPSRQDPGRPARRPLADMFRTLGARPGGDTGKSSQDQ